MVNEAEEMGTGHVLNEGNRARDSYLYYSQDMARLQSYTKDPITVPTSSHDYSSILTTSQSVMRGNKAR